MVCERLAKAEDGRGAGAIPDTVEGARRSTGAAAGWVITDEFHLVRVSYKLRSGFNFSRPKNASTSTDYSCGLYSATFPMVFERRPQTKPIRRFFFLNAVVREINLTRRTSFESAPLCYHLPPGTLPTMRAWVRAVGPISSFCVPFFVAMSAAVRYTC